MLVSTAALYLALIHVLFLSAISMRLSAIGYPGRRVIGLCIASLSLWPVLMAIGIALRTPVLARYYGLTAILAITMVYYIFLEMRMLLERDDEKRQRIAELDEEARVHDENVVSNDRLLAAMFPIKSYLGDDSNLTAISDLGKLKGAGIPCRIEGGIVKMLYVREADIAQVEKTIAIDSQEVDGG